ncbi:MAG: cytochrome C oxidase subunit II [Gemmatimonadetes bacterium]|nr:MAG: cytochrome C oxidase subunit II [Gemmatimonadota bacterium]
MYAPGTTPPQGVWWKPAHRSEKIWFTIAFVWCMILFAMMPFWHLRGGQNPSGTRSTVEPTAFAERVQEFIDTYQVGEDNGIPLVEPPPGSDIYLQARMWSWTPVLRLRAGAEYTLHLSSLDVNHGFNLFPFNVNFQVVPGYDYALRVTPTEAGEFQIVCNEFCGVGHHLMVGKVIVVPADAPAAEGGDR